MLFRSRPLVIGSQPYAGHTFHLSVPKLSNYAVYSNGYGEVEEYRDRTRSSISSLVVFAAIYGLAPGRVLVIGIKDQSLRQDDLSVKVAALIANAVWNVASKQAPFVATAMLSGHLKEQLSLRLCPVACPLLLYSFQVGF